MPTYLYTARSPDGRVITDAVEGPTLEGARYALELRHLTEIRFHTDDHSLRLGEWARQAMGVAAQPPPPPAQQLASLRGGGTLALLWSAWLANAIVWVPLCIWCFLAIRGGRPYGTGDVLGFVLAGLFLFYFLRAALPRAAYQRLLEASTWGRERETRACVRVLGALRFLGGVAVPRLELDMRLAGVLARNDKRSEATQLIAPYAAQANGNPMLLGRLAGFWDTAGEHETALRLREQAVAATAGQGLHEIIDHAHGLARHLRRPAEAAASLARIAHRELAELPRIFVLYTEGLIALEQERFADAERLLSESEAAMRPLLGNPSMRGLVRDIWAFRALALAAQGRKDEARTLFARARQLLEARRDRSLLERCRAALG